VEQPIHVLFPDEEKVSQRDEEGDLQTETVEGKLKTRTDEGSSFSKDQDQFGTEGVPIEVAVDNLTHSLEKVVFEGNDNISSDSGIWICVNELYM